MKIVKNIFLKRKTNSKQGFTLIELLVSIAIIVILSTSLYLQQRKFDSAIFLTNTAQEIAMSIREAQTYSLSSLGGTDSSFGVYFNVNSEGGKEKFTLFEDDASNVIRTYNLTKGTEISGVNGTTGICSISFRRPNPEPIFSEGCAAGARIRIKSKGENVIRDIVVSPTGQVSVE